MSNRQNRPARAVLLGCALVLLPAAAACGGAASPQNAPPASTPTSTAAAAARPVAPAVDAFAVKVAGGKVEGGLQRFATATGHQVRLTITSDKADEVHLHGYDRELQVAPGKPGVIEFAADQAGIFEVEMHQSGIQLAQIQVS